MDGPSSNVAAAIFIPLQGNYPHVLNGRKIVIQPFAYTLRVGRRRNSRRDSPVLRERRIKTLRLSRV